MTQITKFFEDIYGNEQVKFRCVKGNYTKEINGLYNQNTISLLNKFNEQGYDCYFVVNKGGYKDSQITAFTSAFADFDCGKDENKNYFPMDVVTEYKEQKLERIRQFPLKPTYIVETRNGLHVYWLLYEGATLKQFEECERRLIAYFQADPKVKNPARLLRVPGTYWCKDPGNKYMTTIIEHNDVRYDIADIIDNLPKVASEGVLGVTKSNKCNHCVSNMDTQNPTAPDKPVSNITLIRRQDIVALQEGLNPKPVKLSSHEEVYEHLKQQDLEQFLGKYGRINCIVHDDANPSAGIIVHDKTGHHIYNCQSDECGFKGTIIQVTERLTGLTRVDALRFLRKVYRIEYVETDWQKRQREILAENKRLITSQEFRDIYPEVYMRMKNYTPELDILHEIALRHVTTETFTDSNGYPVFFTSITYVADWCGADSRRVTDRIALLAYLGLINKLPEHEIPEPLLKRAKAKARARGRRRIAFYSIPPYDEHTLSFSRLKATEFKEKGLTMKGWGRELLLRTFGEDEANRVYPQEKGKPITELSEEVTQHMVHILFVLIANKGWTTEREVLEHLVLRFKGQNQFKQKHVKRVLPELLDAYGLVSLPANKELKQRFHIDAKGYPKIIIMEEEMSAETANQTEEKENGQFPVNRPSNILEQTLSETE